MSKYSINKGNRAYKYAMLLCISDTMRTHAVSHFVWLEEGYDRDEDMVHFTHHGHKCTLRGVSCPNPDEASITLSVYSDFDGVKGQAFELPLGLSDIHIKTLERIACEVYNTLWDGGVDDLEWDDYRNEVVVNVMDSYYYPEMKKVRKWKSQREIR